MNIGRRLECGFALLTATVINSSARGGTAAVSDFTPHEKPAVATDADILALFGAPTRG